MQLVTEEYQPIETAPKDGTEILVWARWDWHGSDGEDCQSDYAWRVCFWDEGLCVENGFWSVTENPYTDIARSPTYWYPLPKNPKAD